MTYVAEHHVNIVVFAFKYHKHQVIVADVKELDTSEIDANGNVQKIPKKV